MAQLSTTMSGKRESQNKREGLEKEGDGEDADKPHAHRATALYFLISKRGFDLSTAAGVTEDEAPAAAAGSTSIGFGVSSAIVNAKRERRRGQRLSFERGVREVGQASPTQECVDGTRQCAGKGAKVQ